MDGMLLFAHGARDPAWARPFEEVAHRIAMQRPEMPVSLAYLEFLSPGIADAGQQLASQGCRRIHIVPLFLGGGGHVRRDVPPLVEQLRQRHAGVQWLLHPAIGEQDPVMQAMAEASLAFTSAPTA